MPTATNARTITNFGCASFAPTFTPDGKKILFASNKNDCDTRKFELFLVNLDGTGLEQVTDFGGFTSFPEISPDGKPPGLLLRPQRQRTLRIQHFRGGLAVDCAMKTEFRKAIPAAEIRSLMAFDRKVFPPSDLFDADYWKACVVYWLIVDGVKVGCCAFEEHVDFQDDVGAGGIQPSAERLTLHRLNRHSPEISRQRPRHPPEILATLLRSPSRLQAHRNQHPQPQHRYDRAQPEIRLPHHPNHPSLLLRSQRRDSGHGTAVLTPPKNCQVAPVKAITDH